MMASRCRSDLLSPPLARHAVEIVNVIHYKCSSQSQNNNTLNARHII